MPLRTPRRRISPRTKRRYRAIKHFFRKALGSASQPQIQLNSSITDVTDLKHKIIGLEQQLSEVSKHCRDIIRFESSSQRESQTYISSEPREHGTERDSSTDRPRQVETKVLYKTSERHYRTTDESDYTSRHSINPNVSQNLCVNDFQTERSIKPNKKKSKVTSTVKDYNMIQNYSKKKAQNVYENIAPVYSSTSFHSLSDFERIPNPGIVSIEKDKHIREEKQHLNQRPSKTYNEHMQKNYETFERYYAKHNRNKKTNHTTNGPLDQDFIADIIKKQYKPVKLFDRLESNVSQVTEPVCRDHEFHVKDHIQENGEMCSCCYGRCSTRRAHHNDHNDARSVCDARLYRSQRMPRVKQRSIHPQVYDDNELYDLVPVKEYSTPKSKRKVFQECIPYDYYKEVPPSPKTHRPKLNLKAQYYTASEDQIDFLRNSKRLPPKLYQTHREITETCDSDETEELPQTQRQLFDRRVQPRLEKVDNHQQIHDDDLSLTSGRYNSYMNEQTKHSVDTPLNKTLESDKSDDKTDRALCEIKDILQSFLQEIKKEATSQSVKSDVSTKMDRPETLTSNPTQTTQVNAGVVTNTGHSFNNYNVPPCPVPPAPFISAFQNPCCYPLLPVCPMNCMQNGYVVPSPSYTCGNCTTKLEETVNKSTSGNPVNDSTCDETDELIKEIYKFVAQSPTFTNKREDVIDTLTNRLEQSQHKMTTRSAGGNTEVGQHDVNVGTPNIRSYSKSCEAIGSRMISEYYSGTNASYSETGLENVSVETSTTTKSTTGTEISTDVSEKDKATKGKFTNMLRSLGLFKKKRDAIEEEDESVTSIEPDLTRRSQIQTTPFRQHLTDYAMYEQQAYHPPPQPPTHRSRAEYGPERIPPYNPGVNEYHMPHIPDPMQLPGSSYYPGQSPSAPPFANYDYHPPYTPHDQPQPPLCLQEIEVKSIGCQSERKLSFFRKITKKAKQPDSFENQAQRNFSTQTPLPAQNKPGLFSWKSSQPSPNFVDPLTFSYNTQKKIVEGDFKLRNAMLKKMLYKKNPFSPKNLLIRTLLGKDKSSWGNPPTFPKPRMFL